MRWVLLLLALTGLLAGGCGEDEQPAPEAGRERANEVSGPGFTTETPEGFSDSGGGGESGGVVLTLIGPYRASEGFPPNITVARTPAPPNSSVDQVRGSIRSQIGAQGGRGADGLPDREIDGEPAIGVAYSRRAPRAKLTQRTYAVVQGRHLYTIASTTPQKSTVDGEKVLETVLDGWRWAG
ncbi:MAG: hypothetical protein M3350_04260 [Actinomycetota bacterium]|nr:hypothetical protein [Actinomycetota bacterium]MDQ3719983.1 hypothetical protein [Actinomycetota bacterium]